MTVLSKAVKTKLLADIMADTNFLERAIDIKKNLKIEVRARAIAAVRAEQPAVFAVFDAQPELIPLFTAVKKFVYIPSVPHIARTVLEHGVLDDSCHAAPHGIHLEVQGFLVVHTSNIPHEPLTNYDAGVALEALCDEFKLLRSQVHSALLSIRTDKDLLEIAPAWHKYLEANTVGTKQLPAVITTDLFAKLAAVKRLIS